MGDVLIQGLWEHHSDVIIDVRFGYDECDTYNKEPLIRLLAQGGREGKDNRGKC